MNKDPCLPLGRKWGHCSWGQDRRAPLGETGSSGGPDESTSLFHEIPQAAILQTDTVFLTVSSKGQASPPVPA